MAVADQGFLLFYFNGRLGFGLEAFVLEGHQSHTFSFPSSRLARIHTQCLQMRPCFNNTRKSRILYLSGP
ncbi:hypothetical protein ACFX2J_037522 [Malus domestica]